MIACTDVQTLPCSGRDWSFGSPCSTMQLVNMHHACETHLTGAGSVYLGHRALLLLLGGCVSAHDGAAAAADAGAGQGPVPRR